MNSGALKLAGLVARTLEKKMRAEGQPSVRLSDDCVRLLAEILHAVDQRSVILEGRTPEHPEQPSVRRSHPVPA